MANTITMKGKTLNLDTLNTFAKCADVVGGEANVCKIVHQYLKNKARESENQELLKWAKAQRKSGAAKASA